MAESQVKRKLAAILSADVVGYSKLMADDEAATVDTLKEYRAAVGRVIDRHGGRVVNAPGDNILAEFPSAVEAVQAACEIQQVLKGRNLELRPERRMEFRIGVNLGDVIEEDDGTIYGDGVNIAARMEALAESGGICVASSVYDAVEGKLDFGFDFLGEQPVKNVAKPVRVYRVRAEGEGVPSTSMARPWTSRRGLLTATASVAGLAAIAAMATWWWNDQSSKNRSTLGSNATQALPSGPSIAVLPFIVSSGSGTDIEFSNNLLDGIIAGLSRFERLMVASRTSTSQFQGKSVDVRDLGKALGVKYILEGSVQSSVNFLRITVQLLDADDGQHVWSETYDREFEVANLLGIQDEITRRVVGSVGSMESPMWQAELRKLRDRAPTQLDAYECVVLSIAYYNSFAPDDHEAARDCLESAVAQWPNYQPAWTELAWMYLSGDRFGINLRPNYLEQALAAALRANELNPRDYYTYWAEAMIRFQSEENMEIFRALAKQALELNPYDAVMVAEFGTFMAYSGDWDEGLPLINRAMEIQPRRWMHYPLLLNHYRKGEYDAALIEGQKANMPDNLLVQSALAASYGQLGQTVRARAALERVLAIQPQFAQEPRYAFRKRRMPDDLIESLMDGLRKAGLDIPNEPVAAE